MTNNQDDWQSLVEEGIFYDLERDATGTTGMDDDTKRILVEIVSALHVPSPDLFSDADPYVSVTMGDKELHQTKVLYNNPNPIWTVETGSLFLIEYDENQVNPTTQTKVSFLLQDYSMIQKPKVLGTLQLSLKDLK